MLRPDMIDETKASFQAVEKIPKFGLESLANDVEKRKDCLLTISTTLVTAEVMGVTIEGSVLLEGTISGQSAAHDRDLRLSAY